MVGNIGQYENCLRDIAERTGCVAIYPEYRLSPETMFPGGVEDCVKTLDWLVEHADELGVDATRVAVAGDSAGGSLTNAVVLDGSHADRIKLVAELYPLVDGGPVPEEWSYDLYEIVNDQRAEALSRVDRIRNANDDLPVMYTNGNAEEMLDPRVSALFAEDVSAFPARSSSLPSMTTCAIRTSYSRRGCRMRALTSPRFAIAAATTASSRCTA